MVPILYLSGVKMFHLTVFFVITGFIGLSITEQIINTTSTPKLTSSVNPKENKIRCFKFVGCFDNSPPFDNALFDLPNSPEQVGTQMFLFTRSNANQSHGEELSYKDLNTITKSHYDSKLPTKFIIHGFTNTIKTEWLYTMKDELLKQVDANVIIVSWGPGASFPDYDQAVANTRMVGTQIRLIIDIMLHAGCNLKDVHLIGHSLGAHSAGYAGYLFHGQIGRITGLDPAEPDYEKHPIETRLDSSDAVFVDAMHTNGASIFSGGAGLMQISGDVDFYVNGGEVQPGCPNQITGTLSNIFTFNFGNVGKLVSCSHDRAVLYFIESINSLCPFTAYKCKDYETFKTGSCLDCGPSGEKCAQNGYFSDQSDVNGTFYLNTRDKTPFCGFHYAINFTASGVKTEGQIEVRLAGDFGQTSWFMLTDGNEKIQARQKYVKLFVSEVEVGQVSSVQVRYKAKPGILWGYYGKVVWEAESVEVYSGELGERSFFCLRSQRIATDKVLTLHKTTNEQTCH